MAADAALWASKPVEVQLMSRVCSVFLIAALFFILIGVAAAQVDLGVVLENIGSEVTQA
jgi:hypothetical protein